MVRRQDAVAHRARGSSPQRLLAELPPKNPVAAASAAGLRHVHDDQPGIRRVRCGKSFRYVGAHDRPVRDPETLRRIRSLVIPPAWTSVWICPHANGHLQATGRDARGRKQGRYHPHWREVRDETKYGRMIAFGAALASIRSAVQRDLALHGLPRPKVLATLVYLLEHTFMRVGNEDYARANGSFGLTTLRTRHALVRGSTLRFEFRGKSGVYHSIELHDRRIARIVRDCQHLPGQELFQYLDETGRRHAVDSADVNEYLRAASGGDFTAKDFRTWAGTILAAQALREFEAFESLTAARKNVVRAIEAVAKHLGNTKTVCRKCYVHPAVIDAYLDGSLLLTAQSRAERAQDAPDELLPEEAGLLVLLQRRLKGENG